MLYGRKLQLTCGQRRSGQQIVFVLGLRNSS
jgi:hypothetical protein